MKFGRHRLLMILLPAIFLAGGLAAYSADFTYSLDGTNATITGYIGAGGDVAIPSETNGSPVTAIAFTAFDSQTSITSVVIPDSVTNVGLAAFQLCTGLTNAVIGAGVDELSNGMFIYCTSLETVSFPGGISRIGDSVFHSCSSLKSFIAPAGVTYIGTSAFRGTAITNFSVGANVATVGEQAFSLCISLTNLSVDVSNPTYMSTNGILYDKVSDIILCYPAGKNGTSCSILDGTVAIAAEAFDGCSGLKYIDVPLSVTDIGSRAFAYCTALEVVTYGQQPPSIGSDVYDNSGLVRSFFRSTAAGWGGTYGGQPTAVWPGFTELTVSGASVSLTSEGNDGEILILQKSTNLTAGAWVPVDTNTVSGGSASLQDNSASGVDSRYYRTVIQL